MRLRDRLRPSAVVVAVLAALMAVGGTGMRALHLAVAHAGPGSGCSAQACVHGDAGRSAIPLAPAPADGESDCDTCAAIEGLAVDAVRVTPVPAVHALVAVIDDPSPSPVEDPTPPRAVAARPPPCC